MLRSLNSVIPKRGSSQPDQHAAPQSAASVRQKQTRPRQQTLGPSQALTSPQDAEKSLAQLDKAGDAWLETYLRLCHQGLGLQAGRIAQHHNFFEGLRRPELLRQFGAFVLEHPDVELGLPHRATARPHESHFHDFVKLLCDFSRPLAGPQRSYLANRYRRDDWRYHGSPTPPPPDVSCIELPLSEKKYSEFFESINEVPSSSCPLEPPLSRSETLAEIVKTSNFEVKNTLSHPVVIVLTSVNGVRKETVRPGVSLYVPIGTDVRSIDIQEQGLFLNLKKTTCYGNTATARFRIEESPRPLMIFPDVDDASPSLVEQTPRVYKPTGEQQPLAQERLIPPLRFDFWVHLREAYDPERIENALEYWRLNPEHTYVLMLNKESLTKESRSLFLQHRVKVLDFAKWGPIFAHKAGMYNLFDYWWNVRRHPVGASDIVRVAFQYLLGGHCMDGEKMCRVPLAILPSHYRLVLRGEFDQRGRMDTVSNNDFSSSSRMHPYWLTVIAAMQKAHRQRLPYMKTRKKAPGRHPLDFELLNNLGASLQLRNGEEYFERTRGTPESSGNVTLVFEQLGDRNNRGLLSIAHQRPQKCEWLTRRRLANPKAQPYEGSSDAGTAERFARQWVDHFYVHGVPLLDGQLLELKADPTLQQRAVDEMFRGFFAAELADPIGGHV